jgi:hypothetical protein
MSWAPMRPEIAEVMLGIAFWPTPAPAQDGLERRAWRVLERAISALYREERMGGEWIDVGGES